MKIVYLLFLDLNGKLRVRTIPEDKYQVVLQEGTGFDGSSVDGFATIENSDLLLKPIERTKKEIFFSDLSEPFSTVFCEVYQDDKRFSLDPRYVLEKTLEEFHQNIRVGAEVEFYFTKNGNPLEPENLLDRYCQIFPDETESLRMEAMEVLEKAGLDVEYGNHEVGPSQSEICIKYSSPINTSENIILIKFLLRRYLKESHTVEVNFMPKPWAHLPGNGMHFHISMFDNGNLFYDNGLSQFGRYFIGGILEHARGMSAIMCPTVNSYRRLKKNSEAPVNISWGFKNRSCLIRVPLYSSQNLEERMRIEYRASDPLANPYLALSVLLKAGLEGVRKKIDPGDPLSSNAYEHNLPSLPKSLLEALSEMKSDTLVKETLGSEMFDKYIELKEREIKDFLTRGKNAVVNEWERLYYSYW